MTPIRLLDSLTRIAISITIVALLAAPAHADDSGVVFDAEREDAAYAETVARGDAHYLRAVIEMTAGLLGGTAWYWLDRERQVADWDFPSWKQRFNGEAWAYDNNPFGINFVWHVASGTAFHVLGRANDLNLWSSAGFGFLASLSWEYLLEFREKISINDTITTTAAGVATGEFVHWLGRYVNGRRAGGSWLHGAARWTAGLPIAVHRAIDGERGPRPSTAAADSLGFRSYIWHRFELGYGISFTDVEADGTGAVAHGGAVGDGDDPLLHEIRLGGRLVALPGYLEPGTFNRFFHEGNVTQLSLGFSKTRDDYGVAFHSDAVLLGVYGQDIPAGGLGTGALAGVALGYTYRRETIDPWQDRLAAVHLPGLALDGELVGRVAGRPVWLHTEVRVHGDFAGLDAIARETWLAANPDALEKTVLRKQGYYFGWGWSARAAVRLVVPRVDLGGSVFYGRYDSHEGRDRNQEDLDAVPGSDTRLADRVTELDAFVRVRPLGNASFVELRVGHQHREASHDDIRADQTLQRLGIGLGAQF